MFKIFKREQPPKTEKKKDEKEESKEKKMFSGDKIPYYVKIYLKGTLGFSDEKIESLFEETEKEKEDLSKDIGPEGLEFLERINNKPAKAYLKNSPGFVMEIRNKLIKLGDSQVGENDSKAKAFFRQACLSEKEIKSKLESTELRNQSDFRRWTEDGKKALERAEKKLREEYVKKNQEKGYKEMAKNKLRKMDRPEEVKLSNIVSANVKDAMELLIGNCGYSFDKAKKWLLDQNEQFIKAVEQRGNKPMTAHFIAHYKKTEEVLKNLEQEEK